MKARKELPENFDFEKDINSRGKNSFLTLHNDDIHSFDYVIESLVDICEHDIYQAEQCTYIVHYKGKCEVKKGNYDALFPLKVKLIEKGLLATIE